MTNETPSRQRYTQFFVLFILGSLLYIMIQSSLLGITKFEDNLIMKNFLIEKANLLHIKIGDRVFPEVLIGKDGWMEYTGGGNLNDYQNTIPIPENGEEILANRLNAFNQYLQSQGITLLIVIAPNKATIYPDKLPEQITPLSERSRFDYLISYLKANNLPMALDLRPALQNARLKQDVFYKTNTHWNGYGAHVAYTEIINALRNSHPELTPYKIENLVLNTTQPILQDIPELMRAKFIKEPDFFYTPKENFVQTLTLMDYFGYNRISSIPNSDLPTLLMIHDSFGYKFLNDYLSMNFGKSHFIHGGVNVPMYLNKETIQQFNPDIIIIEIVARNLEQLANYLSNFDSE